MSLQEDEWFAREPTKVATASPDLPYTQRGGIWVQAGMFGSYSASWPFATITVDRDRITLRCFRNVIVFPHGGATRIGSKRGLMSKGIRIENDDALAPSGVVFWTHDCSRLHAALKKAGYGRSRR